MEISDELRKLVDPSNECCCEHFLSNKCKEWAYNNGYTLKSDLQRNSECDVYDKHSRFEFSVIEKTETKSIFKACQWILDNKDNK